MPNCAAKVPNVRLEISGKRGIGAFKFRGIRIARAIHALRGQAAFAEVDVLANRYLEEYITRQLDRLDVAYMRFVSISRQTAVVETLLPLGGSLSGAIEEPAERDGRQPVAIRVLCRRPKASWKRSCQRVSRSSSSSAFSMRPSASKSPAWWP